MTFDEKEKQQLLQNSPFIISYETKALEIKGHDI